MSNNYMTPEIYIEEKPAFSNSVVAVATAVPAFVGYTERHTDVSKSLIGYIRFKYIGYLGND